MSAANANTFALATPRRPSLDDCGGGALTDDDADPPIAGEMPTSAQLNTHDKLVTAYGAVVSLCIISVTFSGGTPSISSAQCPNDAVVSGTFTVTDNGVGDTSITWPADTFPPTGCAPTGSVNEDALAIPRFLAISNGVRVKTVNASASGVDAAFTVEIH